MHILYIYTYVYMYLNIYVYIHMPKHPKIERDCFHPFLSVTKGCGRHMHVVCTQPRRLAAVSLASRLWRGDPGIKGGVATAGRFSVLWLILNKKTLRKPQGMMIQDFFSG